MKNAIVRRFALVGNLHQLDFEREIFACKLVIHVEHGLLLIDRHDLGRERAGGTLEIHGLPHGKLCGIGSTGESEQTEQPAGCIRRMPRPAGMVTVFFSPRAMSFTAASKPGIIMPAQQVNSSGSPRS